MRFTQLLQPFAVVACLSTPAIADEPMDNISGRIVGSIFNDIPAYFTLSFNAASLENCISEGALHANAPERIVTLSCTDNKTGEMHGFTCLKVDTATACIKINP